MSTKLYDDAIVKKIRGWTLNTSITVTGPDESRRLFEVIADQTNDEPIKLPLIAISRNRGFTILDNGLGKQPMSFDGLTLNANNNKASQLNSIPISIPYQLDIYTRYFEEADEYVRNLVFNIINFPKVEVNIPYNNENYKHVSSMTISSSIEDNSDIPERLIAGQFTRMTIGFSINDARLWDVRYRDVYQICAQVFPKDEWDKKSDKNYCSPECPKLIE